MEIKEAVEWFNDYLSECEEDILMNEAWNVIRKEIEESVKQSASPNNTESLKCAEKIMLNISDRRGFDLYSCDQDVIDDIKISISDIISAHIKHF